MMKMKKLALLSLLLSTGITACPIGGSDSFTHLSPQQAKEMMDHSSPFWMSANRTSMLRDTSPTPFSFLCPPSVRQPPLNVCPTRMLPFWSTAKAADAAKRRASC